MKPALAVALTGAFWLGVVHEALARSKGGVLVDARVAYPLILNSGPGDSQYTGTVAAGMRFGVLFENVGVLIGFDRYLAKSTVGDSSIDADITNIPLYIYYYPRFRESYPFDLFVGCSLGGAVRSFDGVDGHVGAFSASIDAMFPFYFTKKPNLYLAPNVEYQFIGEGSGSKVGSIHALNAGIRLGLDTVD